MTDHRPENCRNRLRDEGKAYPKSGCAACGDGGLVGCPHEKADADKILQGVKDDISVMRLRDGDVLVIKTPQPLTAEHGEALLQRGRSLLEKLGIKGEVVIADAGVELEIVRPAPDITINIAGSSVSEEVRKQIDKSIREALEQYNRNPRRMR